MFKKPQKWMKPGKKKGKIGRNYQGELFKLTPDKLVIPVNDHLDIKISCLTEQIFDATIIVSSFAFDLVRVWSMKDGKEEEHKFEKDYDKNSCSVCYGSSTSDAYLRVKLTENADPLKRKWFLEEKPEGFLKIDYSVEFESSREFKKNQYPLILISENEKVLEMKEKFLESRKNQNRRDRLKNLCSPGDLNEYRKIICELYESEREETMGGGEWEIWEAEKALEEVREGIFQSHWQKSDEMSVDEFNKLKEERKNEWIELEKKKAAERREKKARELEIIKKEEEEKRKKEAANPKPIPVSTPIPEKKKKKKCMIM